MEKMKPCPFCGSTDLAYKPEEALYGVVCNTCKAVGPGIEVDTDDERAAADLINKWNMRAKVMEPPEIYCELCPKDDPSPAVYEAWLRKRDPFLGTKTGHLIKIYICEACKVHPHLCVNDKKEETANEVPAPAGNRS